MSDKKKRNRKSRFYVGCCAYVLTEIATGIRYIGSTRALGARLGNHVNHAHRPPLGRAVLPLHAAIKAAGIQNVKQLTDAFTLEAFPAADRDAALELEARMTATALSHGATLYNQKVVNISLSPLLETNKDARLERIHERLGFASLEAMNDFVVANEAEFSERAFKIYQLYFIERQTQMQIAKLIGRNQSSVCKALHGSYNYEVERYYGGIENKIRKLLGAKNGTKKERR